MFLRQQCQSWQCDVLAGFFFRGAAVDFAAFWINALSMSQNPILPLVLLFVAVIVIGAVVRLFSASRRADLAYDKVERLFSPAERSFLGVLEQILGTQYRIFGKVRLAEIIQTAKGLSNTERTSAFNRICARHV